MKSGSIVGFGALAGALVGLFVFFLGTTAFDWFPRSAADVRSLQCVGAGAVLGLALGLAIANDLDRPNPSGPTGPDVDD